MTLIATQPAVIEQSDRPAAANNQVRIVRISNEFLRELLCFPEGTRIVGYRDRAEFVEPDLELFVSHPDFPGVLPGDRITTITPEYRRVNQPGWSVEFVSW